MVLNICGLKSTIRLIHYYMSLLKSNCQLINRGGVSTTVTVIVDGSSTNYSYNNSPITLKIPGGSTYTISFSDISNYSTPVDNNSYKAVAGSSNNLSYVYNACLLTFSFIPNTASAIVSYNNTTVSNGHSLLVPFESISIAPNNLENYSTPNPITITPSTQSYTVSMEWGEIPTEIKIVDISGNLIDIDSWTGGSNATGVLFNDGSHKFIIAPDEWYGDKYVNNSGNVVYEKGESWNGNGISAWGGYGINIEGCATTPSGSESAAILDFNGESNTTAIINRLSGVNDGHDDLCYTGAPAAEYCRAYYSGYKGIGVWYLPSAGELNQIILNKDEINRALVKISGKILNSTQAYGIWSSTQSDYKGDILAWSYLYGEDNMFLDALKNNAMDIRPICKYQYTSSFKIYTGQFADTYIEIDAQNIINGVTTWEEAINNHPVLNNILKIDTDYELIYMNSGKTYIDNIGTTHTISNKCRITSTDLDSNWYDYILYSPIYFDHRYYITTDPL